MTTDNWPTTFRYISRRLVTEITDQSDAAKQRRHSFSVDINVPFFKLEVHRKPRDSVNLFALARQATEDVADLTGTITDPSYYVRDALELELCSFPVLMGWVEARRVEVAAAFADQDVDGAGRTFVALFGSIQNYLGVSPRPEDSGIFPSDLAGLYQILNLTSEPADPMVEPSRLWDDGWLEMLDRCDLARRLHHEATGRLPREPLAMLARSFFYGEDVELGGERYDRVLLGTPIWIATPEPGPI